jgi:methionyl-tRNA formyltransferase
MNMHPRIVFYGTPDFAVASLEALTDAGYKIVGVVTAPDRPAGRGMKYSSSPVKQFALKHDQVLLQPENLKDPGFYDQLKSLQADLQVVVAFRLLPEEIWSMPPLGTFNLHASLLPQYRGAAPINWVIINGEKETGVTTFFLDNKVDTGKIILQRKILIDFMETAGELHDRLMKIGAELVLKTLEAISSKDLEVISQDVMIPPGLELKKAPKIRKEHCIIRWDDDVMNISNLIRGLNPQPGVHTELKTADGQSHYLKIYKAFPHICSHALEQGQTETDGRTYLKIAAVNGLIELLEVQQAGRKTMKTKDFLRGFGRHFI